MVMYLGNAYRRATSPLARYRYRTQDLSDLSDAEILRYEAERLARKSEWVQWAGRPHAPRPLTPSRVKRVAPHLGGGLVYVDDKAASEARMEKVLGTARLGGLSRTRACLSCHTEHTYGPAIDVRHAPDAQM